MTEVRDYEMNLAVRRFAASLGVPHESAPAEVHRAFTSTVRFGSLRTPC